MRLGKNYKSHLLVMKFIVSLELAQRWLLSSSNDILESCVCVRVCVLSLCASVFLNVDFCVSVHFRGTFWP